MRTYINIRQTEIMDLFSIGYIVYVHNGRVVRSSSTILDPIDFDTSIYWELLI